MRSLIFFLVVVTSPALGANWYVRPSGAGAANGTSYENAWGGFDAVKFGVAGGVATGDALYICGMFDGDVEDMPHSPQSVPANVTFRGDYHGDTGVLSTSRVWLPSRQCDVTFLSCVFSNGFPIISTAGTYVTFDNCTFKDGATADIYYGKDHWTFANCEFYNVGNGIYTHINTQPTGPNYLTVTNCYIHDVDPDMWGGNDGHGIGIQGSSNCIITHNRIENTAGTAIMFWTGSTEKMTNNVVSYNFINTTGYKDSLGYGIAFSADVNGLMTGNTAYGNIILNANRFGICVNRSDYITAYNNVIDTCVRGVSWLTASSHGLVQNNIIVNASQYAVSIAGQTTPGDFLMDYNLYYPSDNTYASAGTHNTHSVVADPLFVSASPSVLADLRLQSGSPAIRAGTPVGLTYDIAGKRWHPSQPSMGAYETAFGTSRSTTTRATTLRGR